VPLSWNQWDHTTWEKAWSYRRHFDLPEDATGRIFLDFEAANVTATVTLNGQRLGRHFGGCLPFSFEITDVVKPTGNVLAVLVDARFNINVPPNMPAPAHSEEVDYWQPGGIYGTATLRAVPNTYITDVAATPRDTLDDAKGRVEITCFIDAASAASSAHVDVVIEDLAGNAVASASSADTALAAGENEVPLVVDGITSIELWDVDSPTLCNCSGA
jgi:beta-galactosidase